MAERRMFSLRVIDSDLFLDMSPSAQILYFHIAMRADDDGFVNNLKKIQRMVGASEADIKTLVDRGFLILFKSGIALIAHWKVHNYIAKDRYKPSDLPEKNLVSYDPITRVYKELDQDVDGLYTDCNTLCIQNGDVGKDRLGKDRIGKDRLEEKKQSKEKLDLSESLSDPDVSGNAEPCQCSPAKSTRFVKPSLEEVEAYCRERRNSVSAEAFMAFYESNGWKVGRNPMKDWKAAVRTWEQRERADGRSARKEQIDPQYLNDEFETDTLEASDGRWH